MNWTRHLSFTSVFPAVSTSLPGDELTSSQAQPLQLVFRVSLSFLLAGSTGTISILSTQNRAI